MALLLCYFNLCNTIGIRNLNRGRTLEKPCLFCANRVFRLLFLRVHFYKAIIIHDGVAWILPNSKDFMSS